MDDSWRLYLVFCLLDTPFDMKVNVSDCLVAFRQVRGAVARSGVEHGTCLYGGSSSFVVCCLYQPTTRCSWIKVWWELHRSMLCSSENQYFKLWRDSFDLFSHIFDFLLAWPSSRVYRSSKKSMKRRSGSAIITRPGRVTLVKLLSEQTRWAWKSFFCDICLFTIQTLGQECMRHL